MRTGVLAATSPIIATMDGDGQNDPHDIPRLLEGWRRPGSQRPGARQRHAHGAQGRPARSAWASRAANWIRDAVLKDDCPDTGCGIKVYWREAFLRLPFFTSMHRYLPALFSDVRLRGRLRAGQRPAAAGGGLQVQQSQPRPGRPLRSGRRDAGCADGERACRASSTGHPETSPVADLAARLKPVNDDGARASAGDKS